MVIVQLNATLDHDGDMRTLDRIIRGINRMEESGYIVARYENYSREQGKRIIMAVQRTDEANDTEFEQWIYNTFGGTPKNREDKST